MDGSACQTVDAAASYRVAAIETARLADLDQTDIEMDAAEAAHQLEEARTLLLLEGFSGKERKRMQKEMESRESGQTNCSGDAGTTLGQRVAGRTRAGATGLEPALYPRDPFAKSAPRAPAPRRRRSAPPNAGGRRRTAMMMRTRRRNGAAP
jgi:hypothetical protein